MYYYSSEYRIDHYQGQQYFHLTQYHSILYAEADLFLVGKFCPVNQGNDNYNIGNNRAYKLDNDSCNNKSMILSRPTYQISDIAATY